MSRAHLENTTTFAEVFTTAGTAYQQNRNVIKIRKYIIQNRYGSLHICFFLFFRKYT